MELVFKGKLVPELEQEILGDCLTKEGYIKWFTLILYKDSESPILNKTITNQRTIICGFKS